MLAVLLRLAAAICRGRQGLCGNARFRPAAGCRNDPGTARQSIATPIVLSAARLGPGRRQVTGCGTSRARGNQEARVLLLQEPE